MIPQEKALLPIAIFDSGVGGLTVAQALKDHLPQESILYLADTASRPFGTKSEIELKKIIKKNCEILSCFPVKMLVIACHTACSLGLKPYEHLNIPIMGITESSFTTLKSLDQNKPKVILGTERTIRSGVYQNFLKYHNLEQRSFFHPCSSIEKMIETVVDDPHFIMNELRASLKVISTLPQAQVLLACTHFPIYSQYIQKSLDYSCHLIDPACDFVKQIGKTLETLSLANPAKTPEDLYLVTQDVEMFKRKFFIYFSNTLGKTNHFFNLTCAMI